MNIESFKHEHHFDQHKPKAGEKRTQWVILITTITMAGEIIAGLLFGSMALLADGLHMASHATALTISALAYYYARKHAHDKRFSFGTGKVGSLAGFTSAVMLAMFALVMVVESVERFINPVSIAFDEAILVAILGLIINILSVFILHVKDHHHEHAHSHHHDHNLKSAYLHVLADALTSVLAIGALLTGKYLGWNWMDPVMGIVGAIMVTRWSAGLLRDTSQVLLDYQAPEELTSRVKSIIEKDNESRVTDLHIWSIGTDQYAAAIELISFKKSNATDLKKRILAETNIVHCTTEITISNQMVYNH